MIFPAIALVQSGLVGPDPIATPGDVPDSLLLRFQIVPSISASLPTNRGIVLEAPAGETVTVDLYVMDDATAPLGTEDDPTTGLGDRKFYLLQTALVLTANELDTITSPAQLGTVYVCPTADTLTGSGIIRGA